MDDMTHPALPDLGEIAKTRPARVLSLGAGVQSSTVALMSAVGELPPFDVCVFADTGWEPAPVYVHLAKLVARLAEAGIPAVRVSAGNIRTDHVDPVGEHLFIRKPRKHPEYLGRQRTFIPVFLAGTSREEQHTGRVRYTGATLVNDGEGIARRTCTKTYKIEPVEREIRAMLGLAPRQRWPLDHVIDQTFGISWDELGRMSDSPRPAIAHCYPLVDDRITRFECIRWLNRNGWPDVPRSACVGCPFHRNDEWRRMRDDNPDEWADAVDFDHRFRARQQAGLLPMVGTPYLHESRVPLDEAPIDEPEETQGSLFGEDCSGFCGT